MLFKKIITWGMSWITSHFKLSFRLFFTKTLRLSNLLSQMWEVMLSRLEAKPIFVSKPLPPIVQSAHIERSPPKKIWEKHHQNIQAKGAFDVLPR